ncbi:SUMO-activating enzyme subunit 2 [Harmonia axyridis]|uniref:SUMO-activating enzyme subunit 2 n=1 Tax=Harmonia axyridis TaxID=115357 RepID=UPI001E279953|nr:SUMO-activating enzyme subunit 2 [Harmonia axyridis]
MAIDRTPCVLSENARNSIKNSKLLVVGAGGIGCEILKNLALSGFTDIEIIDLDTIDVSNLNRQFLFRKEHVGKPKAVVARETILGYNPDISVKAYHDSITSQEYGVNFFKQFNVVLNALDNRAARNHVNRMCLAADIPLIESGTSGYSGQVELIKKNVTQCYECQPKPAQKTFPGCTIRNTPSEPVHCIVWAKHLFNQLFGEEDPDQDVSPDSEDPEAKTEDGHSMTESGNVKRISTRQWAQDNEYNPSKLFNKFFFEDIQYLLKMENLWKSRKPPVPLNWANATKEEEKMEIDGEDNVKNTDMKVWSINKCAKVFAKTVDNLKIELFGKEFLLWDKDDKAAMDFVTACANIRSNIFSIAMQSRFSTKSIAGSIIPAIATANAIIAGLVVLHTFRVLQEQYEKCPSVYLRAKSKFSKSVLVADNAIVKANPLCYVCSPKPFVNVFVNTYIMTVKEFENEILKKQLNMVAPDVILDGKFVVVISSEDGETEANNHKTLAHMGVVDGVMLKCDDFLQNYELQIAINHYEAKDKEDDLYKVVVNPEELKAKKLDIENGSQKNDGTMETDDNKDDSGDEPVIVETLAEDPQEGSSSKRRKLNPPEDSDDDLVILDEIIE